MSFKYESCEKAAKAGDLEELKKMHQAGYYWDMWTTAEAAGNGHLECLKYAHSKGCGWDGFVPVSAAQNGQLECLKYAHENGCKWDWITASYAAENGHLECFKYCFEMWNSEQTFWDNKYDLTKLIDKIDLDNSFWRKLFKLDLSQNPDLQIKVDKKKKEIEKSKIEVKNVLQNNLALDIIKYCIYPFI
jgi:hypothetical protein